MTSRLTQVVVVILLAEVAIPAQGTRAQDFETAIDCVAAFDYSARVNSAYIPRWMAAADVVPALA